MQDKHKATHTELVEERAIGEDWDRGPGTLGGKQLEGYIHAHGREGSIFFILCAHVRQELGRVIA